MDESQRAAGQVVEAGRLKIGDTSQAVNEAAKRLGESMAEQMTELLAVARTSYEGAADAMGSRYRRTGASLTRLSGDLADYVRHHPGVSLSVASSAGLLAGLILAQRRGSDH